MRPLAKLGTLSLVAGFSGVLPSCRSCNPEPTPPRPTDAGADAASVEVKRLPEDAAVPKAIRILEESTRRVAVGESDLYVVKTHDELVRLPKSGGAPVSLGVRDVHSLAPTRGGLYFATDSAVSFFSSEGGAHVSVSTKERYPTSLVLDASRVCWTAQVTSNDAMERSILCSPLSRSDAGPSVWFEGKGPNRGVGNLLFDGKTMVFTRDKAVYVGHSQGKPPTELAKVDVDRLLGADARGIYALATGTYDGTILLLPRNGGTIERLLHIGERVSCAVFDGKDFFVASYHHLPGDLFGHGASIGTLWRFRLGASAAEPIAIGFGSCLDIAVDERNVYFAGYDGLHRVPR